MKFTIKQFTNNGLATIGKANGSWSDLAIKCHAIYNEDNVKYPLAETIECIMENTASDNGYEIEDLNYEDYIEMAADDLMHCNAPFIYNGKNKQITSFHKEVYSTLEAIAHAECASYFKGEPYIQPTLKSKAFKTRPSVVKTKANYPGVYAAPTKSNPNRWVANYRANMQTIKIGYFNSEAEAIQAKKDLLSK